MSRAIVAAAIFLCVCASTSFASGTYKGVDMPTPMWWDVERLEGRSFAFARRFIGPGGARIDMRARQATPAEEQAMEGPHRGSGSVRIVPGWEAETVRFADGFAIGYVVLYRKDGRIRASASVLVKDRRGSSIATFEGEWPSHVHALVFVAARKVLANIRNL